MRYLLDTVALVRHFTDKGKIGNKAAHILDTIEENDFIISVISLMEVIFLISKDYIPPVEIWIWGFNPCLHKIHVGISFERFISQAPA